MLLRKKPKLAFFDIDGTLIGSSAVLSKRTREAVFSLRNSGVAIAVATGRPKFGALKICDELQIDCFSMFSSGSLLANPKNDEVLFEASIAIDDIQECISLASELGLYTELYSKDNYFIEKETTLTKKHSHYLGFDAQVSNFQEIIRTFPINKIVTISDCPELDENQHLLSEKMPQLVCLCSKGASHPEILFNNITASTAGRREGFYKLAAQAGATAEEIIAFGDAESDITFLQLAGLGVAMADAPEDVKKAADVVADKADNDGVAGIIEKIVDEMSASVSRLT